jgi:hypothetical protein
MGLLSMIFKKARHAPNQSKEVRCSRTIRKLSTRNPEHVTWLRTNFIEYIGRDKFDKFIGVLISNARPEMRMGSSTSRMMFWQEKALSGFSEEYQVSFPIDFDSVYRIFATDIEAESVAQRARLGGQRRMHDLRKADSQSDGTLNGGQGTARATTPRPYVSAVDLMALSSGPYRGTENPLVLDLRGPEDRRLEKEGRDDLGGEDEELGRRLCALLEAPLVGGGTRPEVATQIKEIGELIGANGGDSRMRRIAYRVNALYPGGARLLEFYWTGICGWHH